MKWQYFAKVEGGPFLYLLDKLFYSNKITRLHYCVYSNLRNILYLCYMYCVHVYIQIQTSMMKRGVGGRVNSKCIDGLWDAHLNANSCR